MSGARTLTRSDFSAAYQRTGHRTAARGRSNSGARGDVDGSSKAEQPAASSALKQFIRRWNAALVKRGQAPLTNTEADSEFRAQLSAAAPVLRSLLAWLSTRHSELGPFAALANLLEGVGCPAALRTQTWDVRFGAVMAQVLPLFETWQTSPEVLNALRAATSPEELRRLLAAQGIDVNFDPDEAGRENREHVREAVVRLQQLGLAWAIASNAPNPADWEDRTDRYLEILNPAIEQSGFAHYWTDADVWQHLQSLPADEPSMAFWLAVRQASDLGDVAQRLGLSPEAVNAATARLEELKEKARRTKRLVQVCGREFDGSEDNLASLWTHIVQAMPGATLANLSSVELGKVASLVDMVKRAAKLPAGLCEPACRSDRRTQDLRMNIRATQDRHRAERGAWHPNLSLRVHRALSWLDRAEQLGAEDDAGRAVHRAVDRVQCGVCDRDRREVPGVRAGDVPGVSRRS